MATTIAKSGASCFVSRSAITAPRPAAHVPQIAGFRPAGSVPRVAKPGVLGRKNGGVVRATMAPEKMQTERKADPKVIEKAISTIRMLIVDSIENAQAGHPGMAMGCAPLAYLLWDEIMKYNPKNPNWFNRDRFVLSAGHGCILQYVMLHLNGYDLKVDDLKQLCKYESRCPGHPENVTTPGIEVTTGPLGQGTANAVGLAIAEAHLAGRFNRPDLKIVDHYTYCLAGDGCMMEGISNEAGSIAGRLGLGKLIMFYDDNHNTIDGTTDLSITEDVCKRYEALNWHVQHVKDVDDFESLRNAIFEAKRITDKPSFIKVTTTIGAGSPSKQGTASAHHGTFGEEEVKKIQKALSMEGHQPFEVPSEVQKQLEKSVALGERSEADWNQLFSAYKKKYPKEAAEFEILLNGGLPEGWEKALPNFGPDEKPDATRSWSAVALNSLADVIPGLLGGSADLASSNKAYLKAFGDFSVEGRAGRNIRYGVREHAMAGISNGIALHGSGLIPFAATFLVFTDYMRGSMRLSALSRAGVIYIGTHDSIGLGEDGPTHQPIEHLVGLRGIPNMLVVRPGDATEVAGAYKVAISNRNRPTVLVFSRQKLKVSKVGNSSVEGVERGAYVISDNTHQGHLPQLILMGTGAELDLCQKAAEQLREEGKQVRVVSFPSWELFTEQPESYRESVLPPGVVARVSVEAGAPWGWREWVGPKGRVIGVTKFGSSASYTKVFEEYGFTVENVLKNAREVLDDLEA